MRFQFLGYGGAYDPEFGNSSVLVFDEEYSILLDCGYTVFQELKKQDLLHAPDYVFICHFHNDHIGSLASLLHWRQIHGKKIKLIYPNEIYFHKIYAYLDFLLPEPEQYVDFVSVSTLPTIKVIDTYHKHVEHYQSYAFHIVDKNDMNLVYTSDIGDPNFIFEYLDNQYISNAIVLHDVSFEKLKHHAYYNDVQQHQSKHHIIGFHHNPLEKPMDCTLTLAAEL